MDCAFLMMALTSFIPWIRAGFSPSRFRFNIRRANFWMLGESRPTGFVDR